MALRRISMYSRIRVSGLATFCPWKSSTTRRPLVPRPRKNRPSVMRSMFSAVMARFAGERANTGTMLVPIRIRDVTAASWASEVSASSPHDSPMVRHEYPSSSASTAASRVARHEDPGTRMPISPTSPMKVLPALAVHDEAAVDADGLAGHVVRARRDQERDHIGDVFRALHAAERHLGATLGGELLGR